MQHQYIISYISVDRPGLVDQISQIIHQAGGSWLSSRSANLSGMFSGMVQVALNDDNAAELENQLVKIESDSLKISLTLIKSQVARSNSHLEIRVTGSDRTGIVQEFSSALSSLGVNVEELETDVLPAPMSGEPMFTALAEVSLPESLNIDRIRESLEGLSDDLIVEIAKI